MNKTLLIPGEDDYEGNICELEEFLFNAINEGEVSCNDESLAYEFSISDLDYEFPNDPEDLETICSDIRDELDQRLQSYDEALAAHAANSEDGDGEEDDDSSYMPPNVWIEDVTLFVQI